MAQLKDPRPGVQVSGILPAQTVSLVDVVWPGANAVELVFKRADGLPGTQLLCRSDEERLEIVEVRQRWTFATEALR